FQAEDGIRVDLVTGVQTCALPICFAALHAGITYPERARSLVIAGCGYGAEPDKKEKFRAECEAAASSFESDWAEAAKKYALGPKIGRASCRETARTRGDRGRGT